MTRRRLHSCAKTEPSKLRRRLAQSIRFCLTHGGRVVRALLVTLLLAGLAPSAMTLIWLLRDLPPTMIFEGPKKGQGIVDQILPLLIAGMPQYEHTLMRVNRARAMQMLREESFTCDPSLVWTKEREQWIAFSIPAFRAVSNGLVVRREDRAQLDPFLIDGEVDLAALLASGQKKIGVVAERSYGQVLDTLLKLAPPDALAPHYGNDALASLLQMQRLGRLQMLLGYRPEIRYQAQQQGIAEDELQFYPIRGAEKFLSGYIGCTDTPIGRQAIVEINQLLRKLPRAQLSEAYAAWLDPESRSAYLEESRVFFEHQAQP
ncbi:hypothetical protein B7L09_11710 [Pseudomonas mandelii]|uniref:TIGR02285 family protein n=1 Tax=Pseudomonas mandelii TaxID=75612 RepID=UPI000B977D1E|nr:TIGR02285 family protein [Pseudomonas mandelii]OYQ20719.1 hypothetical protein B7L09_11710 [Pseudomonas mandelii]